MATGEKPIAEDRMLVSSLSLSLCLLSVCLLGKENVGKDKKVDLVSSFFNPLFCPLLIKKES